MDVVGYTNELRAPPGGRLSFHVSCASPSFHVEIVRVLHGDPNPLGPGERFERVAAPCDGDYPGECHDLAGGSYLRIADAPALAGLSSFTIGAWVRPSLIEGAQTLWRRGRDGQGWAVELDDAGRLGLTVEDRSVWTDGAITADLWWFVVASFDGSSGSGGVHALRETMWPGEVSHVLRQGVFGGPAPAKGDLLVAGRFGETDLPCGAFDGKIEAPFLFDRTLPDEILARLAAGADPRLVAGCVGAWDFSARPEGMIALDRSENALHGQLVNLPTRAVIGHGWSGEIFDHRQRPSEYGAIFFHREDIGDARWPVSFELEVPADWSSGVYAARLTTERGTDLIPFVVRPAAGRPTSRAALLLPTLSYLAYANEQIGARPEIAELLASAGGAGDAQRYPETPEDRYMVAHRLLSLYDKRRDGTGVCYAAKRRPLLSFRPSYYMPLLGPRGAPHQLCADLHLVNWLAIKGYDVDVLTDEDLHAEGASLLGHYEVVLTGSHPEYYTGAMLDGIRGYLNSGGRLMYLGGNGFYWVTSIGADEGGYIEVRRGLGSGAWRAHPGEEFHSSTGEKGGLWRFRGRAPQSLVGVGMTSMGSGPGRPYRRTPQSLAPEWDFVFEGLGEGDLIGDVPSLVLTHGAGGFEVDRADVVLGTPPSATVLAVARVDSDDSYQEVVEELEANHPMGGGTVNPKVRADMTYLNYPNGGAVFSVGSILWCSCLSHNGYANSVSKVTENVLRKLLTLTPQPKRR